MSDPLVIGTMDDEGNIDGKPFADALSQALSDAEGASAYRSDRGRPYNGQPQTDFGERGRTLVSGLTMRDVMDCFVAGLLDCCGVNQPDLYKLADRALHENLYDVDLTHIDPGAWWQNMSCRIEMMMGIFPNVPKLSFDPEKEDE